MLSLGRELRMTAPSLERTYLETLPVVALRNMPTTWGLECSASIDEAVNSKLADCADILCECSIVCRAQLASDIAGEDWTLVADVASVQS